MAVKYSAKATQLGNYQQRNSYAESLLDAAVAEQQSLGSQQRNLKDLAIQEQKNAAERKQQDQFISNVSPKELINEIIFSLENCINHFDR